MIRKKNCYQPQDKAYAKLDNYKFFWPIYRVLNSVRKQQYATNEKEKKEPDNFTKYGTWSDRTGVMVNIVLAFFTISLFFITKNALDEAKRANKIAQNNLNLAQRIFNGSDEESKKRFTLDTTALAAQIKSLKIAQSEFQVNNMPFIRIYNVALDPLIVGKPITINAKIINYGRPAQILKGFCAIETGDSNKSKKATALKYRAPILFNQMISTAADTLPFHTADYKPLTQELFSDFINKKSFIYVRAEISYVGFATNTSYIYKYFCKITPSPQTYIEIFTSKTMMK